MFGLDQVRIKFHTSLGLVFVEYQPRKSSAEKRASAVLCLVANFTWGQFNKETPSVLLCVRACVRACVRVRVCVCVCVCEK